MFIKGVKLLVTSLRWKIKEYCSNTSEKAVDISTLAVISTSSLKPKPLNISLTYFKVLKTLKCYISSCKISNILSSINGMSKEKEENLYQISKFCFIYYWGNLETAIGDLKNWAIVLLFGISLGLIKTQIREPQHSTQHQLSAPKNLMSFSTHPLI